MKQTNYTPNHFPWQRRHEKFLNKKSNQLFKQVKFENARPPSYLPVTL